jgi:hypothetical protein
METVDMKRNEILEWYSKHENKLSYFSLKVGYDVLPPDALLTEDIEEERDFFSGTCHIRHH